MNQFYKVCASYPAVLVVPDKIDDAKLKEAAHFRMRERIPALSWRHANSGTIFFFFSSFLQFISRSINVLFKVRLLHALLSQE